VSRGHIRMGFIAALLLATAGACDTYSWTTVVDEGILPPPRRVLASPAFASLAFHSRLKFEDVGGFKPPVVEKFEYWADNEILPNARIILRYGYLFTGQDELLRHRIRRNFVGVDVVAAKAGSGVDIRQLASVLEKEIGIEDHALSRRVEQFLADPGSRPLRSRQGKFTIAVERRSVIQLQNEYVALSVHDDTFPDASTSRNRTSTQ
jgi:hypothetical protein